MTCRAQFQLRCRLLSGVALVALGLITGCEGSLGDPIDRPGGGPSGPGTTGAGGRPTTGTTGTTTGTGAGGSTTTGAGGATTGTGGSTTGTGGAGGTGTGGAGGAGGTGPTACTGADAPITKRFIRLTFNQIVNSIGSLFGATLAAAVAKDNSLPDATERSFPPLSNPREGSAITDATWGKGDAIATQVGKYVFDNFATVTACATATDACAQQYIAAFAERAYRRPLVAAETTSLTQVYTEVKAAGGTIQEGVQFSVSSIIESPQFLYRSEFGTDWKVAGALTPYETASQLSYFIADAPPDAPLLDAAKQNKLATAADIDAQATRLLGTAPVKQNLQTAMFAYFGASGVLAVVIEDPQFTQGVAASMYQETTLFINNTLWGPKVTDLVTSRRTWINTQLAFIYNLPAPPGATVDNFVALDLPDNRAGILTSPGYLVARSRPDFPSIVARGLLLNASVLCGINPAFNPDLQAEIDKLKGTQGGWTERQKSEYRMSNQPCMSCHQGFDPYGLTLGTFDNLARFQTMDAQGRPIDSSTTLPANAGGTMVKNASDMGAQISSNGAFAACVAKNLLVYGLAEPSGLSTDSCATRTVTNAFKASTDQSFAALVRAVAASIPLGTRLPGKAM